MRIKMKGQYSGSSEAGGGNNFYLYTAEQSIGKYSPRTTPLGFYCCLPPLRYPFANDGLDIQILFIAVIVW